MIRPNKLSPGDLIALIAPSGAIKEVAMLKKAKERFEQRGYRVIISSNAEERKWYLAGEDNLRTDDLINCFKDPEIKAIFCARGGYGTVRLLNKIDFDIITTNPKIFLGYSDITILHLCIHKYCNFLTFHGPLSVGDFGNKTVNSFTENNMWDLLEGNISAPYTYKNYYDPLIINSGRIQGRLLGGNLAVLCSIMGSKYLPDFKDSILFLEDIGESLYRLDRYLMQLKISGILDTVAGIVFGEFTSISKSDNPEVNKASIVDIIQDIMKDVNTPALFGFSCGHAENKTTLAFGALHELDCSSGILKIVEPFVQ